MLKRIAVLGIVITLFVIGAFYVAADGPVNPGTTFVSPLPACAGIEPNNTVTDSLRLTATIGTRVIVTDSLSVEDTSDHFELLPRCPSPYHLRLMQIKPLVPGFVPMSRIWIGSVGPNGTFWGKTEWTTPDLEKCASDWRLCTMAHWVGCPPKDYFTSFRVEIGTAGVSQDVATCREYSIEWADTWSREYLPLVMR